MRRRMIINGVLAAAVVGAGVTSYALVGTSGASTHTTETEATAKTGIVISSVTSTGKAMLAWMPQECLDQAMTHVKRYTPITLTRRKDIEKDLEETRLRGYAVNRGEFRVGVAGLGAPIRDRSGTVVAALGVWGAEKAILGSRREELAHMLIVAARDVSRDLGFVEAPAAPARIAEATGA